MKVKELIEKLGTVDQNAVVLVYCGISEDADFAGDIQESVTQEDHRPDDRPYVKGDWPDCGPDEAYVRLNERQAQLGRPPIKRECPLGTKVVIIK